MCGAEVMMALCDLPRFWYLETVSKRVSQKLSALIVTRLRIDQ